MPLCDFGCGLTGVLVTAGAERGRIWVDQRRDGSGFVPEDGLGFRDWIETWLAEAERAALDSAPPPEVHPNEPDALLSLDTLGPREPFDELRASVAAAVTAHDRARFGAVGSFIRRGSRITFEQGAAIPPALAGAPLPDVGPLTRLLEAVLRAPPWTGVAVPQLLRAWVREKRRTPMRDYLGRTLWIGDEGRFLTVAVELQL
jgi:hypothetical protein